MKKIAYVLLILTMLMSVFYVNYFPVHGDYNAYKVHWRNVLNGENPWGFEEFSDKDNVYGPVYNLFAIPYALHDNLPRIIFIFLWGLLTCWLIGKLLKSTEISSIGKFFILVGLCLSPFLWIRVVHFSQFDIVAAVMLCFAVDASVMGRSGLSGGLASLGVALKYYPIVVVPQLFIKDRKPDWRFLSFFSGATIIIYGTTFVLWGSSFLKPLLVASERPSKLLSIFQFFRSPYSPLYRLFGIENLDSYSMPLMLLGLALLTILLIYHNQDTPSGALLAFILLLQLYKVGHQQFHVSLYLLLFYWLIAKAPHTRLTIVASVIYLLFINLADIGYYKTTFLGEWLVVRETIGVPTFFILGFLFLAILQETISKRDTPVAKYLI